MPTLTITFTFSSDNGDAELFTSTDDVPHSDGVYDGTNGNPAGSVRFATAAGGGAAYEAKYIAQTFEAWGVPVGSTITGVANFTADTAYDETGTGNGDHWPGAHIGNSGKPLVNTVRYRFPVVADNGDTAWYTPPLGFSDDTTFPRASNELFHLALDVETDLLAAETANTYYDNISFDIIYNIGAGVTGSGALQAQPATFNGYALLLPSGGTESIRAPSQDDYRLIINGTPVPFTSFTVRRYPDAETARISLPRLFVDLVTPASAVTINIESYDVYGNLTVIELFTGVLDTYSASGDAVTMLCTGAGTYPANVVRDFGNVSYTYDDGNLFMYRARVDPRFYPGDIGMFGLRRIDVDKVVYTVDSLQSVMGLMSNGQV